MAKRAAVVAETKAETAATVAAEIDWVPLTKLFLMPEEKNPRRAHKVDAIVASIEEYGFGQAVTVNKTTGYVIGGNGRVLALRKLLEEKSAAPAGIRVKGKQWLVPVLYGEWSEEIEQRVALALNGGLNGSLEGEFDGDTVAEILRLMGASQLTTLGIDEAAAKKFLLGRGESRNSGSDESGNLQEVYQVVVECEDEESQVDLLDRLEGEGFKVRAIVG